MNGSTRKYWILLVIALLLVAGGGLLASWIQTDGGAVTIKDVRFAGTNGTVMSALLYVPKGVTAKTPAPGILAIHGYINSRETQDGFAIEFARRGYVVLALDETGHGYSDPPAMANGFGGPDGLRYLRTARHRGPQEHRAGRPLDGRLGVGHRCGDLSQRLQVHRAGRLLHRHLRRQARHRHLPAQHGGGLLQVRRVLQPDVGRGDPQGRRQRAQAASCVRHLRHHQDRPASTARSSRALRASFTCRTTTHPGDHISREAIGYAIDWFQKTLKGGNGLPPANQTWPWKELGTFVALHRHGAVLLPVRRASCCGPGASAR